jgi:hypothetical protein
MIAVRTALMVMVATVRYPVPGGVSPLASLKMIMVKISAAPWMKPKSRGSPQHYDQAQDNATGNLSLPGLDREERNNTDGTRKSSPLVEASSTVPT